jgi:hypothetical protein
VASKTVVELFDDLDGDRADETVSFALDGVEYEIDLSTANATQLRGVLAEYVSHAHRAPGKAKRPGRPAKPATPEPDKPPAGQSASLTAEIRRLASESARKASEAAEQVEQESFEAPPVDLPKPQRQPAKETHHEQVRALVIPFQEAGL